jgi:hypothetical protein
MKTHRLRLYGVLTPVTPDRRNVDALHVIVGPAVPMAMPACRARTDLGVVEDTTRRGGDGLLDRIGGQAPAFVASMERCSTHGSRAQYARLSLGNFHIACRL